MSQDLILAIIQSLSKAEKRKFSIQHQGADAKGKEWLKLFREMKNPKGFDSSRVVKKFSNEKAYYNARVVLKKELDLFLVSQESGPRKNLLHYSSLALEYIDRQLYDQALDTVRKGKKIADKYEALDELGVLLNLEQSVPGRTQDKKYRLEVKKYHQKRDQYEKVGILSRRLEEGLREVRSSELKISLVNAVLRDAENVVLSELRTTKAAFEVNVLFRKCFYLKNDLLSAVLYSQNAIDCFEGKLEQLSQSSLEKLINEYSIQATLFSTLEDHGGFHKAIAKIRFFPVTFSGLNLLKIRKILLPFLVYALDYGYYEQAVLEFNRFSPILMESDERLIANDLIRIHFSLAKLFFILGKAKKTVFFLNEFHSLKQVAPKLHSHIYPYAELMGIADLIQREISEVANSRLKALKRIIAREGLDYPYFRIMIKIFDHLIQFGSYYDSQYIIDFYQELLALEEEVSSKMHFGYFDPGPFLISFLKKTGNKEEYLIKIQRNSPGLSDFG